MRFQLSQKTLICTLLFSLAVNALSLTPTQQQQHLESPVEGTHQNHLDVREKPGCSEIDSSTKKCLQCQDPRCTSINSDGFCVCEHEYERPNKETGMCQPCYIPGCISCERDKDMTCGQCTDPSATLKDGICSCPEGQRMDRDGKCHACGVKGCDECKAGNTEDCI